MKGVVKKLPIDYCQEAPTPTARKKK